MKSCPATLSNDVRKSNTKSQMDLLVITLLCFSLHLGLWSEVFLNVYEDPSGRRYRWLQTWYRLGCIGCGWVYWYTENKEYVWALGLWSGSYWLMDTITQPNTISQPNTITQPGTPWLNYAALGVHVLFVPLYSMATHLYGRLAWEGWMAYGMATLFRSWREKELLVTIEPWYSATVVLLWVISVLWWLPAMAFPYLWVTLILLGVMAVYDAWKKNLPVETKPCRIAV